MEQKAIHLPSHVIEGDFVENCCLKKENRPAGRFYQSNSNDFGGDIGGAQGTFNATVVATLRRHYPERFAVLST